MLLKNLTFLLSCIASSLACAANPLTLQVTEAFVELHTGPGKHYPVHFIAERDQTIKVLKSRTDWFKISLQHNTNNTALGWVHRSEIAKTLALDTQKSAREHPHLATTFSPKLSAGFGLGQFSEADIVNGFLSYRLANTTAVELHAAQYMGGTEQGWYGQLQFNYAPYTLWRLSPFVALGYGYINFETRATQVTQDDVDDNFFHTGAGISLELSPRYRLRFEYKHFNVLTSTNDNKELESWHFAFASKL